LTVSTRLEDLPQRFAGKNGIPKWCGTIEPTNGATLSIAEVEIKATGWDRNDYA